MPCRSALRRFLWMERRIRWSFPAVASDGTVYISVTDESAVSPASALHAIKPDGSRRWVFKYGANANCSPSIDKTGTVLISGDNGKLYALRPDGSLRWSYTVEPIGRWLRWSPVIRPDGGIYLTSYWPAKIYSLQVLPYRSFVPLVENNP